MTDKPVILGKISGVHGIKGWIKVFSYTRPIENIFQYQNWKLIRGVQTELVADVSAHKHQGKKLLAKLGEVNDCDAAQKLVGLEIGIEPQALPVLENEYYWRDLIGLTVKDTQGVALGEVYDLMETGANDVLLVKDSKGKSTAIPWIPDVVLEVSIEQSIIIADWERLV